MNNIRNFTIHIVLLIIVMFGINYFNINAPIFGDNITFFHELKITDSIVDDLYRNYSPARTRELDPGDTFIFRPVVFAIVTLQGHLFGHANFELHQLTNIVFGALCVVALYAVLNLIVLPREAFWGALFFAVLNTTSVSIRYQHTSGFVLAAACNLLSMLIFFSLHKEKKWITLKYLAIVTFQTIAIFAQEIFIIPLFFCYAILVGDSIRDESNAVTLGSVARRCIRYSPLMLPALLFFVCNYVDYEKNKFYITALHASMSGMSDVETAAFNWKIVPLTLYNFLYVSSKWFFDGLFGDVPRYTNLVLLLLFIVASRTKRFKQAVPSDMFKICFRNNLFKISFLSVFAIIFLYVFFRLNHRGLEYDAHLGLYRHLGWVFFVIMLAVVFQTLKKRYATNPHVFNKFLRVSAVCISVSLVLNISFSWYRSYNNQNKFVPSASFIRHVRELPEIKNGQKVYVSGFDYLFPRNYSLNPDFIVRLGSGNSVEVLPAQALSTGPPRSDVLSAIIPSTMFSVRQLSVDDITASHQEHYFNQRLIYPGQKSVLGYEVKFQIPLLLTELHFMFDKMFPPREIVLLATAPGNSDYIQVDSFFLCTRTHETPYWVRRVIPAPRIVDSMHIYLTDTSDYFDTKKPTVKLTDFALFYSEPPAPSLDGQ